MSAGDLRYWRRFRQRCDDCLREAERFSKRLDSEHLSFGDIKEESEKLVVLFRRIVER